MAKRDKIYSYLLEIVTIFIGITLSFAFEEFRQARNEKHNRQEIIQSMISDIEFKKKEIQDDIVAYEWQYKIIDSCLWLARHGQHVPRQLAEDMYAVITVDYAYFETSTPTFSSLTSTGIWQQLPDSLRREIYNSYHQSFTYLNKMYSKGAEYSSYIQQHYLVSKSLVQPTGTALDVALINRALAETEFRSAILLFRNQNYNTIRRLKHAHANLDHLNKSLNVYVNSF